MKPPTINQSEWECEGVIFFYPRSPLISNLRLCSLSELQPETRFNRLLHKKQFEQAEILAKEFDLDVEVS